MLALLGRRAVLGVSECVLGLLRTLPAGSSDSDASVVAEPAAVSAEGLWQLLFDVCCTADLLAGSPVSLPPLPPGPLLARAAASWEDPGAVTAIRAALDPFDLHVRGPAVDQARARCVQRCSLLLGCFAARSPAIAAVGETPGLLAALAPPAPRFALLPVAQRPAPPPQPTVALSSAASVFARVGAQACGQAYSLHAAVQG